MSAIAPLRRIVVGMDGSPAAQRALAWAAGRSGETGAGIVAVHVLTYSREFATDLSLATITTWRHNLERDLAGPWTEPARSAGVPVRALVVEDESPAAGIMAVTAREGADLIVVGTHGHGNIADRLLGATTYLVTHRARTPVVVIPPDWHPSA
jgi:nucleotide-binding universal stress UspA family protein